MCSKYFLNDSYKSVEYYPQKYECITFSQFNTNVRKRFKDSHVVIKVGTIGVLINVVIKVKSTSYRWIYNFFIDICAFHTCPRINGGLTTQRA